MAHVSQTSMCAAGRPEQLFLHLLLWDVGFHLTESLAEVQSVLPCSNDKAVRLVGPTTFPFDLSG